MESVGTNRKAGQVFPRHCPNSRIDEEVARGTDDHSKENHHEDDCQ